jgi:DNA-directed RNA polymerase sigma subunit (sigma70/sigma32)
MWFYDVICKHTKYCYPVADIWLIKFTMCGFRELTQDLLKLEAVQKEVAHYNGGEPTFGQWAAAAGTDEHTLRKRLSYGIYCKNMMVKSNVRLVISIAKEFEGPGTEFSDLIQVYMLVHFNRISS